MTARSLLTHVSALVAVAALGACEPAQESAPEAGAEEAASFYRGGVMQVTAEDFHFKAPDRIPSGWTTIRFTNAGREEHFLYLYRLPDEVTFAQFQTEAMEPFYQVWERYEGGELTRAEAEEALHSAFPEWFMSGVTPAGGVALTEPGETSQATVQLEPGTYVLECYVKTAQGAWHAALGMQAELVVGEQASAHQPPEADLDITLSNYEITVDGEPTPGEQWIAVHVEEDPEGFMPHDLNLFRLTGDTTVDQIVAWMDWMDLEQFRAPAPGVSLGGLEHMAAGRTGYITVELTPGRYAWVSEAYGAQGMVAEFTVE